ncbi:MAG: hypothetical protein KKC84_04945 [Candidatus Omnitrophica bacterium]|nr:hypothetical protein [Candidatus Omnitrophota bacterium]
MKVEKDTRRVRIACLEGLYLEGTVYVNPGERVMDYLNDQKKSFFVVAEVCIFENENAFFHRADPIAKRNTVFLNRSAIHYLEEVEA